MLTNARGHPQPPPPMGPSPQPPPPPPSTQLNPPPPPPNAPTQSSQNPASSGASNNHQRWIFSDGAIRETPSMRSGVRLEDELLNRQKAANFIQDMGQRLQVTQLCINTAIVYMQRFYMFHSFTRFHRNTIASAALFLAAKVEEQPRKLEHVIKVAHICLHRDQPQLDTRSEAYMEQAQDLVTNENILLQTLGFDVAIVHPHTHVLKCCQLVKATKELAQTSYFMATNSLHLTTMCLRYPPATVACVCIHLACKWSKYNIPISREGKEWYEYIDPTATHQLLEELTNEFLQIFERCPSRLKKKIMSSTKATKEEEDRRIKGDISSSHYQVDLSVNPSSSSSAQQNSSNYHQSSHQKLPGPPHLPPTKSNSNNASGGGVLPPKHSSQRPNSSNSSLPGMPRTEKHSIPGRSSESSKRPLPPSDYLENSKRQKLHENQTRTGDPKKGSHHSMRASMSGGPGLPAVSAQSHHNSGKSSTSHNLHAVANTHPSKSSNSKAMPSNPHMHHSSKHSRPQNAETSHSSRHSQPSNSQHRNSSNSGHSQDNKRSHSQGPDPHQTLSRSHHNTSLSVSNESYTSSKHKHHQEQKTAGLKTTSNSHQQRNSRIQNELTQQVTQQPPPPQKSIFDIEPSDSPIRGTSLSLGLIDPMMSPPNLSEMSDLDAVGDVDVAASSLGLEPGEILDTPNVNNTIMGFTFPSSKSTEVKKEVKTEVKQEEKIDSKPDIKSTSLSSAPIPTLKSLFGDDEEVTKKNISHPKPMSSAMKLDDIKHEIKPVKPTFGIAGLSNPPSGLKEETSKKKREEKRQKSLFSPPGTDDIQSVPSFDKLLNQSGIGGSPLTKKARTDDKIPTPVKATLSETLSAPNVPTLVTTNISANDDSKSHKEKKKKKKEKKDKKEKKEKDKKKEKEASSDGERKHKKKHKDKDRERSSSKSHHHKHHNSAESQQTNGEEAPQPIKITLKLPAAAKAQEQQNSSSVAPIKLKTSSKSSSSRGEAAKMSRVMGTGVEMEKMYLNTNVNEKGGKHHGGHHHHHHHHKSGSRSSSGGSKLF